MRAQTVRQSHVFPRHQRHAVRSSPCERTRRQTVLAGFAFRKRTCVYVKNTHTVTGQCVRRYITLQCLAIFLFSLSVYLYLLFRFSSGGGGENAKSKGNNDSLQVITSLPLTVAAHNYPGNILLIGPIFGTIVKPDFWPFENGVLSGRRATRRMEMTSWTTTHYYYHNTSLHFLDENCKVCDEKSSPNSKFSARLRIVFAWNPAYEETVQYGICCIVVIFKLDQDDYYMWRPAQSCCVTRPCITEKH